MNLKTEDKIAVWEVINENSFVVKMDQKPENLFVYGKYVDDFHTIDYDAISMLNVFGYAGTGKTGFEKK